MKKVDQIARRGSVLMEFIIVFPIYLVLFGGVFMIGDMLVHSSRLASAERTSAFDLQAWEVDANGAKHGWSAIQDKLFHISASGEEPGRPEEIADDNTAQDALFQENAGAADDIWNSYQYADIVADCPWTLLAAMKIRDGYKLPVGGTAGRLSFVAWFLNAVAPAVKDSDGNALGDMSSDANYISLIRGLNRTAMYSKDNGIAGYTYNYYTLKRTRYAVDSAGKGYSWRDNRRPASDLMVRTANGVPDETGNAQSWERQVRDEKWHDSIIPSPHNEKNPERFKRGQLVNYERYDQFVNWSE